MDLVLRTCPLYMWATGPLINSIYHKDVLVLPTLLLLWSPFHQILTLLHSSRIPLELLSLLFIQVTLSGQLGWRTPSMRWCHLCWIQNGMTSFINGVRSSTAKDSLKARYVLFLTDLRLILMFTKSKKVCLDKTGHPDQVTIWIKDHRKFDVMPDVSDNLDQFAESWSRWWLRLQPDWRSSENGPLIEDFLDDPDFPELEKGGPNGIFLLILSLGWWGMAISDQEPSKSRAFCEAMHSLQTVLDALVRKYPPPNLPPKRINDESADPVVSKCAKQS